MKKTRITINRKPTFSGCLAKFKVKFDNTYVGCISNGKSIQFDATEGKHRLEVSFGFTTTAVCIIVDGRKEMILSIRAKSTSNKVDIYAEKRNSINPKENKIKLNNLNIFEKTNKAIICRCCKKTNFQTVGRVAACCIATLLFVIIAFNLIGYYIDSFIGSYSESNPENFTQNVFLRKLNHGEEFMPGCYIVVDGVKIGYNGNKFIIENGNKNKVMVTCSFYGAKNDGTYEFIGMPAFYGFDKKQYNIDKEENGWAMKKQTNQVKPNDSLVAELEIFDFGENYPKWDIDEDGYYDISFTISQQRNDDTITVSTNDIKSDYYKLKAK